MYLQYIPEELVRQIELNLDFEDSLALSQTCRRMRRICNTRMQFYDKMQISDDANECRLEDTTSRRPPLSFQPSSATRVLVATSELTEISILMKEMELTRALSGRCCSPFTHGGYLGPLLYGRQKCLRKLKQLSLHADLMVESIKDNFVPCPNQDLLYALSYLADQPFQTFIQISACCAQYHDEDLVTRNALIANMQSTLKMTAFLGAETEFAVEPDDGYMDMTVKKGNAEYSFAFFYYNPSICEVGEDPAAKNVQQMV